MPYTLDGAWIDDDDVGMWEETLKERIQKKYGGFSRVLIDEKRGKVFVKHGRNSRELPDGEATLVLREWQKGDGSTCELFHRPKAKSQPLILRLLGR